MRGVVSVLMNRMMSSVGGRGGNSPPIKNCTHWFQVAKVLLHGGCTYVYTSIVR